jgi:Glycosyltransferase family 87
VQGTLAAPVRGDLATIRWSFVIRGVLLGMSMLVALVIWSHRATFTGFGADARGFYDLQGPRLYEADDHLYLWSPAFAQITTPLRDLPFDSFLDLVRGLDLVAMIVLAPLGSWLAAFLPPVGSELSSGNINLVLAACVVFGFRWPALWTLPLLTKPSLGVALLWFVVRRGWRHLVYAIGPAIAISLVSFLLTPQLWFDWFGLLTTAVGDSGWPFPVPLWIRLPIAVILVVWGARTERRWAAVLGAIVAMPRLYFMTPAMLLALLPTMQSRDWAATAGPRRVAAGAVRLVSGVPDRRPASAPGVGS